MIQTRKLADRLPAVRVVRSLLQLYAGLLLQPRVRGLRHHLRTGHHLDRRFSQRKVQPPDPLPDATDPTTECAKCCSNAVYVMEDGGLVCGQCGMKLLLEINEVAPG